MTMRAPRALLAAMVVLAGLGVASSAAPAGAATAPPKAITLTTTPSTTVWSQTTTLALWLTPKGGGTPKGGTVTFTAGDEVLGTAVATKRVTTFSTAALDVGEHAVTATYSGDSATGAATSAPVVVSVAPAPTTTTLTATTSPVAPGELAELKAVIRPQGPARAQGRPGGAVTFVAGTKRGTVRVNANGVATWRPLLPTGTHEITATYDGTAPFGPSTSGPATVVVAEPEPAGELDAGNPETEGGLGAAATVAQTFTALRSGMLTRLGIAINTGGRNVTLALYETENGFPVGDAHSVQTIATEWVYPDLNEIVLDEPFPVTAGTQYAFVITPPDTQNNIGYRTTPDRAYTGGSAYLRWPWETEWDTSYRIDLGFQTWVVPTPVP